MAGEGEQILKYKVSILKHIPGGFWKTTAIIHTETRSIFNFEFSD